MKTKKTENQFFSFSIRATKEENEQMEIVKNHYKRKSNSDMLRFLIQQEAEKILSKSVPVGTR